MSGALTANDLRLMDVALAHAFAGLGTTAPNPSVGCVIARDGRIIATGATAPGGRPHAEAQALDRAGEAARGADVYVTLEPCSHQGETPPCASALIRAGVARVFVACTDPDVRVSGRGIAMLRDAGIEVIEDVRQKEGEAINAGFFTRVRTGLPLVLQDRRPNIFDADLVPGPEESIDAALQRLGRDGKTRVRLAK